MNFGERLVKAREYLGYKQNAFAEKLGMKAQSLARYEKNGSKPSIDFLEKLTNMFSINANYLIGNDENILNDGHLKKSSILDNFYNITKLSIHASAGVGIENFHIEEIGQVLLDKELFRYNVNPKSLKVIQVKGDSMQPTIMDDAHVVIDESQREHVDAVYAICLGGQVLIKRLQFKRLEGTIVIRSDNPNYDDEIYNPKESQVPLKILGKKVLVIQ